MTARARRPSPPFDWSSVREIGALRKRSVREDVDLAAEGAREEIARHGSLPAGSHSWSTEYVDWGSPRLPHWR